MKLFQQVVLYTLLLKLSSSFLLLFFGFCQQSQMLAEERIVINRTYLNVSSMNILYVRTGDPLSYFNVFQSVLSFIAPPMAAVFVMGVFWKRCTTLAANMVLSLGTIASISTGICYLWVIPNASENMHFMMLSFIIFCSLILMMILISIFDKQKEERKPMAVVQEHTSLSVKTAWLLLAVVMVCLYLFFN